MYLVLQPDDNSATELPSGKEGIIASHFYMINKELNTLEVSNKQVVATQLHKIFHVHIKTHGRESCDQVWVHQTLCYLHEQTCSHFQPFIAQKLLGQSKSHLRCFTILLPYVSNLKGIGPAVPKVHNFKTCLNFFIFCSSQNSLIC